MLCRRGWRLSGVTEPMVLVDLDGTLTREELLPRIARYAGIEEEMARLTDATLLGLIPFAESFRTRVAMLSAVPVDVVHEAILSTPVFEDLLALLCERPDRVVVVTGNLDVWVQPFLDRYGLAGVTSHAAELPDGGVGVASILNKGEAARRYPGRHRIALGDGANDAPMVDAAETGIAWCGVHRAADSLMEVADYAFADEGALCRFLRRWL
jgi:phosphoserine phosphatase